MNEKKHTNIFFLMLIAPFNYSLLINAQVADTMRVLNSSGMPGDTMLTIAIFLTNTFPVSGITFRITYNGNLLTAKKVDTTDTRVSGIYNSFTTQVDPGWLYWCGLNYYDPMHNSIPPGTGSIANVIFRINPNAQYGVVDSIKFMDDDSLHYYNALSDTFGILIFPILVDGMFSVGTTNVSDSKNSNGSQRPQFFALDQNYPNPFNAETTIRFALPIASHTSLNVYNIAGQLVKTLVDDQLEAGFHTVNWNSKDNYNENVSSGVYFFRIIADDFVAAKKMVLTK